MKKKFDLSSLMRSKITWAVIAECLILLVCLIIRPDFFKISYQESTGMLYGSLIDIINRSAEITIIAMGMTLAIALGGTDLSVGALVAVSGAIAGGVSANRRLRELIEEKIPGRQFYAPTMDLCGDNGAMIAAQGYFEFINGRTAGLELNGIASLPIDFD